LHGLSLSPVRCNGIKSRNTLTLIARPQRITTTTTTTVIIIIIIIIIKIKINFLPRCLNYQSKIAHISRNPLEITLMFTSRVKRTEV
jgi:hypothetical protein